MTVLRGHTSGIDSAAFSPDSKLVATVSPDDTTRVWDVEAGRELLVVKGRTRTVTRASFSPDSRRILVAGICDSSLDCDSTAQIWDIASRKQTLVLRGHAGRVNTAAYSPDGQLVVTTADDHVVWVWDADTGRGIFDITGHDDVVRNAVVQPGQSMDCDGGAGTETARVIRAPVKSAQGWTTENTIFDLRGHTGTLGDVVFSPDSKYVLTASADQTAGLGPGAVAREGESYRSIAGSGLRLPGRA